MPESLPRDHEFHNFSYLDNLIRLPVRWLFSKTQFIFTIRPLKPYPNSTAIDPGIHVHHNHVFSLSAGCPVVEKKIFIKKMYQLLQIFPNIYSPWKVGS